MDSLVSKLHINCDRINLKELTVNHDFKVKSVLNYCGKEKNVSNAVVFIDHGRKYAQSRFTRSGFKDCLIIHSNNIESLPVNDGTNLFIYVSDPIKVVGEIIDIDYINDPTFLDQNKLRFNDDRRVYTKLERVICPEVPNYGYNDLIGIHGDVIYQDDNGKNKEFISVGGVQIGKNVHIGNNVTIYRGLTEYTIIDDNVIIPDNVIIHHDAHITKDTRLQSFNEYF